MADIGMKVSYSINLSNAELVIVLRALGGRMNGEEEMIEAKELGDRLSVIRAQNVRTLLSQNERLFENLEKAGLLPSNQSQPVPSSTPSSPIDKPDSALPGAGNL